MYSITTLPHPPFVFDRKKCGAWQQTTSSAAIGICFSVAGLLIMSSPRVTSPQLHQLDNRGQTPVASVVIQMNAAPAYQETEPEAEQLPPAGITVTGRTGNRPPESAGENSKTTVRKTGSKSREQKSGEIRTCYHNNYSRYRRG